MKASKNSKRVLWLTLFVVLAVSYPWFYISLPIQGKVIDSGTGKPLQGVIILANWDLYVDTFMHKNSLGPIYLNETITDDLGEFRFSFWIRVPLRGSMESYSPVLRLYKQDYRVGGGINNRQYNPILFISSDFDGKSIELEPFVGTQKEYAEHIKDKIDFELSSIGNDNCILNKAPLILQAMEDVQTKFMMEGINTKFSAPRIKERIDEECSGIEGLLRRILF